MGGVLLESEGRDLSFLCMTGLLLLPLVRCPFLGAWLIAVPLMRLNPDPLGGFGGPSVEASTELFFRYVLFTVDFHDSR